MKLVIFELCILLGAVFCRPNFRDLIPNGQRVPCPEGQEDNCMNDICEGVGHLSCLGGGDRNSFGMDFQAAGFSWTKELCESDSDGDGIPNGVELGDPCCQWKQGQEADEVEVSHPRFDNSIPSNPSQVFECSNSSEVVKAPSSISQFESEGDSLYIFEYRFDEHIIPSDLNSYFDVKFNFPMNETYDIIGSEPIIDNAQVLHHYVVMACNQEQDDQGVPVEVEQEGNSIMSGCRDNFYAWAVGGGLSLYPPNAGFRIGKGTDRLGFNINIHYNNALQKEGLTDASGVRFYMTTKLRELQVGQFGIGGLINVGEIPAQKKSYYSTTFCRVEVDTEIAPDGVEIFAWLPHTHYLGRAVLVERVKNVEDLDAAVDDVIVQNDVYAKTDKFVEEWNFNYNNQDQLVLPVPLKLQDGDLLATTCIYDSTSRDASTFGGQKTEDEMCIASLMYTPRDGVKQQLQCAIGDRYNGEFPETATSILEVELQENFNYKKAMEEGYITCPEDFKSDLENMCPDMEELGLQNLILASGYQCSQECALHLYQMIACNSSTMNLGNMLQGGGSGLLGNLGGTLGGTQSGGSELLGNLGGNLGSQSAGTTQPLDLSQLINGGGGIQNIQDILKLLSDDPSILFPPSCVNKMEDYVDQQKFIKSIVDSAVACDEKVVDEKRNLEKEFEESCLFVAEAKRCDNDCVNFISEVLTCEKEGVENLEGIVQLIEEEVGEECADAIAAFRV